MYFCNSKYCRFKTLKSFATKHNKSYTSPTHTRRNFYHPQKIISKIRLRIEQHLSCKGGEKNQKNGNLLATHVSLHPKKSKNGNPLTTFFPRAGKNQKNGNLSATLVCQHSQNQILIKMQSFTFYENEAFFGITLATLACPQLSWRSNTYPSGSADNRKLS